MDEQLTFPAGAAAPSMHSIRDEDDGRPFNADLFHQRVRQAQELRHLAAGSKSNAAVSNLQQCLAAQRQQSRSLRERFSESSVRSRPQSEAPRLSQSALPPLQARSSTPVGLTRVLSIESDAPEDRNATVSIAPLTSFESLPADGGVVSAPVLSKTLVATAGGVDYTALGRHYQTLSSSGTLKQSASSPAKRFADDLSDWRSRRLEVESALGQEALADGPKKKATVSSAAKAGAVVVADARPKSIDPAGRLQAGNPARAIHQIARLRLAALEQGLTVRMPGLSSSNVTGSPSRAITALSRQTPGTSASRPTTRAQSTAMPACATPTAELEGAWGFEEERLRRLARARQEEERTLVEDSINMSVSRSAPQRAWDRETEAVRERLNKLEEEDRNPVATRQVLVRSRYGHRRDVNTAANALKGDDDAGAAGQRKGRLRDELSRWGDVVDMPLHGLTETGAPYCEWDTNIPEQDLHLYQLYCYYRRMIIVIRPVSSSVPSLNAGNFFLHAKFCDSVGQPVPQPDLSLEQITAHTTHDCRVRGKSINVSLKSSTYPPIDGLIPVNPALGKAYLEAQRREREIEDLILNAKGGVVTITLLKKLKVQKAQAGSLTQAFRRDIEQALKRSNKECAELLEQYKRELVLTVDKGAVSQQYIDRFNEAQYLGTTNALWRGLPVFYAELPNGAVVRNERDVPYFYIKKSSYYYRYHPEHNDIERSPEEDISNLKPVLVVTHRMFAVSSTTQRIEEDPESYLIGPDFDGLCYGSLEDDPSRTLEDRQRWAEEILDLKPIRSMGLVSDSDMAHVREVRELTAWKQNHGYECTNTVKTQPLTPGTYVVITPELTSILKDVTQIIGFYRTAWRSKYPLLLNPNWRVAIDSDHLPRPYGEDLVLPLVDDCGMAALMSRFDAGEGSGVGYDEMKKRFTPMEDRLREHDEELERNPRKHNAGPTLPKTASDEDLDVFLNLCRVLDRKHLADLFFAVRRWQLLPPWRNLVADEEASQEEKEAADLHVDEDFEMYRLEKIETHVERFDTAAKQFRRLWGKSAFVDTLYEFLSPEPDADSDSSVSSLGSMADFVF